METEGAGGLLPRGKRHDGFHTSANGRKFPRLQILTSADLLDGKARAEHPDDEPDLNFKKANRETDGEQPQLAL